MMVVFLAATSSCSTPPQPVFIPNTQSEKAREIVQQNNTLESKSSDSSPSAPLISMSGSGLSSEDQNFISNHLSKLSYMVYYSESSGVDPQFAKIAVSQANRYLLEKQGKTVIDFDQIECNKKDQQVAYQTETGGSIDIIQYLAQKYNADVYVEIDLKASASGSPGSYSATAQGSMKLFETSTASLLGSIAFMSPATFSPTSPDSAISNAIAASVWQAMPKVTEQSKVFMAASMSRGLRYDLVLQNTPDAKQISQFIKALSKKLREVEQLSFSPSETRLALYAFLPKGKIQEAVNDAAQASLISDMYLVYMRGRSFTFNTGL